MKEIMDCNVVLGALGDKVKLSKLQRRCLLYVMDKVGSTEKESS